jgi:hypothetical protein
MPKDLTRESVNTGEVVYEWVIKEYEEYDRSTRWYISMFVLGAALIGYALYTANYLFALILVLFGIVLYLHEMQSPLDVYFAITQTGIIIGKRFYRFSELTNFWVIYNPPVSKNLYFRLGGTIRNRLRIPLLNYDPRPIREVLLQFIEEDAEQEDEPISDRLARVFKIH